MNEYRCTECGQIVERRNRKKWIRSLCERTGKMVRLKRVDKP